MKMSENFSCGSRIRELRTERGLSQEQLALTADITPAYLGLVERGVRNATVRVIERLCRAMNVSLASFFSMEDTPVPAVDETEQQILGQLSVLTDEEKSAVLQTVKSILQLRAIAIRNSRK